MRPPIQLEDIAQHIPDVVLDIRYATTNNFTGVQLYNHQIAWLRLEPLEALVRAASELRDDGYTLVIFDAFRTVRVQERLKSVFGDTNYVAEISNHCRGITVDITLADASGVYVDMGTDYDDFTEKSHADADVLLSEQERINRKLLTDVMKRNGFSQHPNEWWHFDYQPERAWSVIEDDLNTYVA